MPRNFAMILMMSMSILFFNQAIFSQNSVGHNAEARQIDRTRLAFFEKLSKDYYGVEDFAPELELVNRFARIDLRTPHANLIIPSIGAIAELKYQISGQLNSPEDEVLVSRALVRFGGSPTKIDKVSENNAWHPSNTLFALVVLASFLSISFSIATYIRYRQKLRAIALVGLSGGESLAIENQQLIDYQLDQQAQPSVAVNLAVLQGAN